MVISSSFVGNHRIIFAFVAFLFTADGVVCADDKRPEEGTVGREEDEGGIELVKGLHVIINEIEV